MTLRKLDAVGCLGEDETWKGWSESARREAAARGRRINPPA